MGINCTRIDPIDLSISGTSDIADLTVAGCLGERESFSRWLTAPFRSARKAAQVLPSILDIQLPFPLEDCTYLFLPGGIGEDGKTLALAVAARSTAISDKLAAFKKLGFDPVALDQEGIALWTQSVLEIPPAQGTMRVVVSLSGNFATMALGKDGLFSGSHSVRQSADHIGRILRTRFGSSPQGIDWAWTGPDAAPDKVESLLTDLRKTWPGKSVVHKDPVTFLARAIATRALSAGPMRCNLRTGELAHPVMAIRQQSYHLRTTQLVLAAGLILAATSVATTTIAKRLLADTQTAFSRQVDKLAGYHVTEKGDKALAKVKKAQRDRLKVSRPFDEAFEPSLVKTLDSILKTGRENGLAYETLFLGREKDRINTMSVTGSCATWN
ncbi:MAG: hypothetical protein WCN95_10780, partial [bacterium]